MKLVINACYGGFGLSDAALAFLGIENDDDIERDDPRLVALVELNSTATSAGYAELKVVKIPDNATDYHIDEYDGYETVIYVVGGKIHWAK